MSLLQFTPIIRLIREMCCYNLELQLERQLDRTRAANLVCEFRPRFEQPMRSPICSGVHASSKSNFKQKASSYITHVCECLKPYQVSKTRRYDPNFGPN